jgi:hypothetical protein
MAEFVIALVKVSSENFFDILFRRPAYPKAPFWFDPKEASEAPRSSSLKTLSFILSLHQIRLSEVFREKDLVGEIWTDEQNDP